MLDLQLQRLNFDLVGLAVCSFLIVGTAAVERGLRRGENVIRAWSGQRKGGNEVIVSCVRIMPVSWKYCSTCSFLRYDDLRSTWGCCRQSSALNLSLLITIRTSFEFLWKWRNDVITSSEMGVLKSASCASSTSQAIAKAECTQCWLELHLVNRSYYFFYCICCIKRWSRHGFIFGQVLCGLETRLLYEFSTTAEWAFISNWNRASRDRQSLSCALRDRWMRPSHVLWRSVTFLAISLFVSSDSQFI